MKLFPFLLSFIVFYFSRYCTCTEPIVSSKSKSTPPSSSSARKRITSNLVGDDTALIPEKLAEAEQDIPYIQTVSIDFAEEEQYPVDRLKEGGPEDSQKVEILQASVAKSELSRKIERSFARPNFMNSPTSLPNIESWLKLDKATVWDAVRIFASPNFIISQYKRLNDLPLFYLKMRSLVPFEAFFKRFRYLGEIKSLQNNVQDKKSCKSTPFSNFIF